MLKWYVIRWNLDKWSALSNNPYLISTKVPLICPKVESCHQPTVLHKYSGSLNIDHWHCCCYDCLPAKIGVCFFGFTMPHFFSSQKICTLLSMVFQRDVLPSDLPIVDICSQTIAIMAQLDIQPTRFVLRFLASSLLRPHCNTLSKAVSNHTTRTWRYVFKIKSWVDAYLCLYRVFFIVCGLWPSLLPSFLIRLCSSTPQFLWEMRCYQMGYLS